MAPPTPTHDRRVPTSYLLLGFALLIYVGACTVQRDNNLGSDGWEHHRTILTLTRHLWRPGNPTYASDIPSVRYSPYTIFWAGVCRVTHITPYAALSVAAVINTALLWLGLWLLLDAFGETAAATSVLLVMVALYGGAPGWANSYALSDLPWHQINPSAIAFAFVLIAWAVFWRIATGRAGAAGWLIVAALMAVAMLDHGMTAAFGMTGLMVLAVLAPAGARVRMLAGFAGVTGVVAALCTAWPWFSFWTAVRWKGDPQYWFNRWIFLDPEMKQWIVPAVACSVLALPLLARPLVRVCFLGGLLAVGAGASSYVTHSPTLARFPLPGLVFFHIVVGLFAHEAGVFRPATWPGRLRAVFSPLPQSAYPILQVALAGVLVVCVAPQVKEALSKPWLARPYLAGLLHRADKQEHLARDLKPLLALVGERDVVLSDVITSWLVPSFNGKIVAAQHYELFVPDQRKRWNDVDRCFRTNGPRDLDRLTREYNVKWIVLNRAWFARPDVTTRYEDLLREPAVVNRAGDLVLMDAARWLAAGPTTRKAD